MDDLDDATEYTSKMRVARRAEGLYRALLEKYPSALAAQKRSPMFCMTTAQTFEKQVPMFVESDLQSLERAVRVGGLPQADREAQRNLMLRILRQQRISRLAWDIFVAFVVDEMEERDDARLCVHPEPKQIIDLAQAAAAEAAAVSKAIPLQIHTRDLHLPSSSFFEASRLP